MAEGASERSLRLAQLLLQVLRLLRLHTLDNVVFEDPLSQLEGLLGRVTSEGQLRLQAESGSFYLDKRPLLGGRQAFAVTQGLLKEFAFHGLAELIFLRPPGKEALRTLAESLARHRNEGGLSAVREALVQAGLNDCVRVYAEGEATATAGKQVKIDVRTYFPMAYSRCLVLLRAFCDAEGKELGRYFSQKLQRATAELAGLVQRHESRLLALTTLREGSYLHGHMVNTAILSIVLGNQVGLGRSQLAELGYAAILHGLGQLEIPPTCVAREDLSPSARKLYRRHPALAVGCFVRRGDFGFRNQLALLVAAQHDLHRVAPNNKAPLHPYSMIVRICATYDEMVSARPDRPAFLPEQAIQRLKRFPPRAVDPHMVTILQTVLGRFPSGSAVRLSGGEVAVVVQPNPASPRRPLVAVVRDAEGAEVAGELLDLTERGERGFLRSIERQVDADELGIRVPDYLLALL